MIYAVGDNPVASRLAGRAHRGRCCSSSTRSAACSRRLAGSCSSASTTPPTSASARRSCCPSVAAVVIGGTSIFGGLGGYAGTILGALILTVLDSLLTILNASQAARQIIYGLIVLALAAIYARAIAPSDARGPDRGARLRRPVPRADRRAARRGAHVPQDARRLADERRGRGRAARTARRGGHEGRRRPFGDYVRDGARRVRRRRVARRHRTRAAHAARVLRDLPARRLPAALLPRAEGARPRARSRPGATRRECRCSGRPAPGSAQEPCRSRRSRPCGARGPRAHRPRPRLPRDVLARGGAGVEPRGGCARDRRGRQREEVAVTLGEADPEAAVDAARARTRASRS